MLKRSGFPLGSGKSSLVSRAPYDMVHSGYVVQNGGAAKNVAVVLLRDCCASKGGMPRRVMVRDFKIHYTPRQGLRGLRPADLLVLRGKIPKLRVRVRFSLPAPLKSPRSATWGFFAAQANAGFGL
ncbi:hypothetical protein GCM10009759_78860 [Kitasatospora saccharophila]|uniref:Uncharacterized protein n=1 Tax=Kitasatospora saccharophila TaxID=407973 RepID=A0ABN2YFJ0_9ACTN